MKKVRVYMSFMKERDWLEKMAAEGWLLKNITLGMIYHFIPIEPCEKVYEIDRFSLSSRPSMADLTAKTRALDIAVQFGWQQITHDEDMNYYFVKDKANDETDEFYDDEESRKERAKRYCRHFCVEIPFIQLSSMLIIGLCYFFLSYFSHFAFLSQEASQTLLWVYLLFSLFGLLFVLYLITLGEQMYTEFMMSRSEWEQYQLYHEKKRFRTIHQMLSYLTQKNQSGFVLQEIKGNRYLFAQTNHQYQYFIDSKEGVKKRCKQEGLSFSDEKKDWYSQSTNWYELSIAYAAKYHLEPIALVHPSLLLYRRPFSADPLPVQNSKESFLSRYPLVKICLSLFLGFLIGCVLGGIIGYLFSFLGRH